MDRLSPPAVTFTARLTASARGSGGAYIPVPREVAISLRLKGMPKIKAIIAGSPYRGSLMPMGDGTYGLGVAKSIREVAGLDIGGAVTVQLAADAEPRIVEVPADLAKSLARDPRARKAWEQLSYTNRKEAARDLETAKRPETRQRRLSKILERLKAD